MARRTFEVTEILVHWHAGRSQAEIATSLGVDRKTVRKYTTPAVTAGMRPGGEALEEASWVALVRSWFPELIDTRLRQSSWPAIEVFHEQIREQMALVTLSTVHQRLRDEHGLAVSLSSLRRYVHANLPEERRCARRSRSCGRTRRRVRRRRSITGCSGCGGTRPVRPAVGSGRW